MNACPDFYQAMRAMRSRRETLSGLARLAIASVGASLGPGLIPRDAFGAGGSARDIVVCIFLRGGADGLSIVAPYADPDYVPNRPTLAIPEPSSSKPIKGLDLDGYFALHPSLIGLKELYDAGSLAVVTATGSIDPTRSHFDAQRFMEQATPGDKTKGSGWLARHLSTIAVQTQAPLLAVGFGGSAPISLRGVTGVSPVGIDNLDYFGLDVDDSQQAQMQSALQALYGTSNPTNLLGLQAKLAFDAIAQLGTLDLDNYRPANGAEYPPESYFAFGLKQTALLIKQGLGMEVACVDLDNWDTHSDAGTNDGFLKDQLKELNDSLIAFIKDLGPLMANVTIVTMSEFGRRVEENADKGTDHGHGNVMFLAGGGVNGGKIYGTWPTLADDQLDDGDIAITTDQRQVLWELLSKRCGNTAFAETFPDYNGGAAPAALGIFK
jgi:uncharacterized protein (DUF1501 family)